MSQKKFITNEAGLIKKNKQDTKKHGGFATRSGYSLRSKSTSAIFMPKKKK